jgi:site-specific DNA recombinase
MSDDRQENSIERQKSQVEPYALRQGYDLVRTYEDLGIAGDEVARRKDFARMLKDAAAGQFDVILCDDKDRFGRFDSIDYGEVVAPLRRAGVRLETVAQGAVDWNTLAGRMMDQMVQEFKAAESKTNSRRVMTRMLLLAKAGKWPGGSAPYGYRLEAHPVLGKRLVPGDPRYVAAVRLIFDLYGNRGFSMDEVARELRARGVPDPKGGQEWKKPSIRVILRNRKYVGDMTWNLTHEGKYSEVLGGQVNNHDRRTVPRANKRDDWIIVPDVHEALIDRDLFERVQIRLAANKRKGLRAPANSGYLLSGMLFCGHCGWRMVGGSRPDGARFYYCGKYHATGKQNCHYNRILERTVVPCLVQKLKECALNPAILDRLREELRSQEEAARQEAPGRVQELRREIARLSRCVDQGNQNMTLSGLSPDAINGIAQAVRASREVQEHLARELDLLERGTDRAITEKVLREAEAHLWRLQDALGSADPALMRDVLRDLVSRIEVWFTHRKTAKQTRNTFARGLIHTRVAVHFADAEGGGSSLLVQTYEGKRGTPPSDSS